MSPIWGMLGAWYWVLRRIPTYLWYTHYKNTFSFRVTSEYAKKLFCATAQSMPMLEGSQKKVVIGHGIDLGIWPRRDNVTSDSKALLAVHRLSRSKRLELSIKALSLLPVDYTLAVYGIEAEPEYVAELRSLVSQLQLNDRVIFHGTVPTETLPSIYTHHRLILNMASETIDKTMLEAMTCGCYPVTTKRNAEAIGIADTPNVDSPGAIADFIRSFQPTDPHALYQVVANRHSLTSLIATMSTYILQGT